MHKYWQDVNRDIRALEKNEKQQAIDREHLRFAKIYSDLIHSGNYTEDVVNLELSFQPFVDEMLETRDISMLERQSKSSNEIEAAINELGKTHTEATITSLSAQHCQDMDRLLNNWNMSIEALKDAQKEQFQEKLESLHKQFLNDKCTPSLRDDDHQNNYKKSSDIPHEVISLMEESFTINLGSQLKTTLNLRLIAIDSLHLCDFQRFHVTQARIQSAMTLYSRNLSAIVMLVSNQFKSYYGCQHEFARMCGRLNEFHFDSFEKQVAYIKDKVMPSYAGRQSLEMGDCYITKHSNLANAHIVFHLVTNDSLKNEQVNSRHPILASIRNILRTAHMYEIKTISIPLLLVDEMDEEILSLNWCLKRAELVLKCVKGFLIEMASLSSGIEQETIQFLVPKNISSDLFTSLSTLIPEVFRVASSLNLKSSLSIS